MVEIFTEKIRKDNLTIKYNKGNELLPRVDSFNPLDDEEPLIPKLSPRDPSKFEARIGDLQMPEPNRLERLSDFISQFLADSSRPKPTLEEAAKLVKDNGGIADYEALQYDAIFGGNFDQIVGEVGLSERVIHSRMIRANLRTCMEPILDKARALPAGNPLRQLMDQMDLDIGIGSESEFHIMLNGFPEGFGYLTAPEAAHGRIIEMLLSETKPRREFLKILDADTKESTSRNLAEIDEASLLGERVLKDVVIVGGGPLTAIAAAILSPFREVTVITAEERLGEPMRSRPIHLNSSVEEDDPFGRQLPFAGGSTTPTNPRGMLNQSRIGEALLDETALEVVCSDRSIRRYLSAQRLGEGTAAAIRTNTSDIITGQMAEVVSDSDTDYMRLKITDQKTGEVRELGSKTVLFLGGPGQEVSKFRDQDSNDLYDESAVLVKLEIERLRTAYDNGELAGFKFKLPPVLSLTTISDLLEAWDTYLDRDPDKYPLGELLDRKSSVAVLGSADTGRTMVELLTGRAPFESYPEGFDKGTSTPEIAWYNQTSLTAEQHRKAVRRRYSGTWTREDERRIKPNLFKAKRIKRSALDAQSKSRVVVADLFGREETFDYVIVATGFERASISEDLVYDADGNVVGRGNGESVYYGGSYAGIEKGLLPQQLQNIIDGLGIPENTISMWVNAILLQRLAWTIAAREEPNYEKLVKAVV